MSPEEEGLWALIGVEKGDWKSVANLTAWIARDLDRIERDLGPPLRSWIKGLQLVGALVVFFGTVWTTPPVALPSLALAFASAALVVWTALELADYETTIEADGRTAMASASAQSNCPFDRTGGLSGRRIRFRVAAGSLAVGDGQ